MKIAVVGIGGVGGYFGGRLVGTGADVHFLVREKTLLALREKGLRVDSIDGDFHIDPVQASDDAATIGPVDVVLVAVKTWQLETAAQQVRPMLAANTLVVPLQNGVEAADILSGILGGAHVVGGMCRILSHKVEPGWIRHTGSEPDIHFGTWGGEPHDLLTELHQLFEAAGVKAYIHDHIRQILWRKFLFVVTMGSVGTLIRAPIGIIRDQPETRDLLLASLQEIRTVATAHAVDLPESSVADTMAFIDGLPAAAIASMQRDITAGRPSELEAWTGAVVRLGREKSVPTPFYHLIYHCLLPWEKRARGELDFPA